ncbi:hypothetical protein Vi05172_g4598 [Venturia inaequalis]|nr:hypothetical protein Vi05172_g4598 [Venturia inaequalis]
MKLSTFLPIILALATPTFSCSYYKRCWCEMTNITYEKKEHQNVPWDEHTVTACREPGEIGYDGIHNFKTCFRYKQRFPPFLRSYSIKNCDWRNQCQDAGASTGYCVEKI